MKNRKKVILHRRDGWGDDRKLALTDDQINLLNWMADHDLIDNDTWDIQVLEDAESWEEV
jgi:hypothetical protein